MLHEFSMHHGRNYWVVLLILSSDLSLFELPQGQFSQRVVEEDFFASFNAGSALLTEIPHGERCFLLVVGTDGYVLDSKSKLVKKARIPNYLSSISLVKFHHVCCCWIC